MNDSNDMPATMWEPLKFPAGVAEQDYSRMHQSEGSFLPSLAGVH